MVDAGGGAGQVGEEENGEDAAGFEWFDLSDQRETVIKALRCYTTQLTVHEDHIVHVGGQRAEIRLRVGLRLAP